MPVLQKSFCTNHKHTCTKQVNTLTLLNYYNKRYLKGRDPMYSDFRTTSRHRLGFKSICFMLTVFCCCIVQFLSDLVGNRKDSLSCDAAPDIRSVNTCRKPYKKSVSTTPMSLFLLLTAMVMSELTFV